MSRAERRSRTEKIVKSRSRKNYYWANRNESWAEFFENVKSGIHSQWIKHTGTICSCWMCSKADKFSKKDRRETKQINLEE